MQNKERILMKMQKKQKIQIKQNKRRILIKTKEQQNRSLKKMKKKKLLMKPLVKQNKDPRNQTKIKMEIMESQQLDMLR